ncbi:uncharacterized protein LOC144108858 [Amblyomma americanum]
MESFVTYVPQLYEQPPSKKQRLENPMSSGCSYYSSYCDGTSTPVRSESAATHAERSSSCLDFTQGTRDDRETASNKSVPSSASGNFRRISCFSYEASHCSNQGGESADSHAHSQARHDSSSQDSVVNSATCGPSYGSWGSEETYSFPVQSDNRSNADVFHFPIPRVVQLAQDGWRRQVDTATTNPVSHGDKKVLPNSSLNSNSIYGFLPRGYFVLPNNGGVVSISGLYSPGSCYIKGNNGGQFDGSSAGSNSDCNTWYSAPYVQNCGSVQGSSVGTNPALYYSPLNLANIQDCSKIVSAGFSNISLPALSSPAAAQVACGSSNNASFLFPYLQNFIPFPNSAAHTYPGAFFTSPNVLYSQSSSQIATGEFTISDSTNSASTATAHVATAGVKSSTDNMFYCSPHEQNCTSITDGALYANSCVNFWSHNITSSQCSSQIPPTELGNNAMKDLTATAAAQNGGSWNPGCNYQETASHDCMHGATKHDTIEPATIPDSIEGVIPASIVEVSSGDLREYSNSVTTATTYDRNAISEETAAQAADIGTSPEIGPRLFPNGYVTKAESLILQASLDAVQWKQQKLKWPLPIPINIKVQNRNMSFRNIDYDYVTQCVYRAAREEVCAQGIDKNGRLQVFVKSPRAASNLLQMEDVAGVAVQCSIAPGYTDTIGYIRGVPRSYSETALFELLQDEGIICAKRQVGYLRYYNGAVGSMITRTVVLVFLPDRRLPQSVTIGHVSYEVIRRLKLPTQCFNCQRFGHYARDCVDPVSCRLCAGSHAYEDCFQKNKPRCTNCRGNHASTFWRCPVRLAFTSADPRNAFVRNLLKDIQEASTPVLHLQ